MVRSSVSTSAGTSLYSVTARGYGRTVTARRGSAGADRRAGAAVGGTLARMQGRSGDDAHRGGREVPHGRDQHVVDGRVAHLDEADPPVDDEMEVARRARGERKRVGRLGAHVLAPAVGHEPDGGSPVGHGE